MRVAVLGTGGVGGYFGARLASVGIEVVFIARGEHLNAIRTGGLRLESPLGDVLLNPAQASDSIGDIGPVDFILLGVKTWQVQEALDAMRPCMSEQTVVVPLQNGVETPAILADGLGADHVMGGLCGVFSFIAGPGHIRHLGGPAFVKFGELNNERTDRVKRLQAAFEQTDVMVEVPDDIHVAMWEKCMLVVPAGGLGAITGAPYGPMLTVPETRQLLKQGMEEVYQVARARGVLLPEDKVAQTLAFIDEAPPNATASLQRDIAAGKRSELDSWVGAVVRLGAEVGVDTPIHSFMYGALFPRELRARGELVFPE